MTPVYYVIAEYVQNMPQNMYGVSTIRAIHETTLENIINGQFSEELGLLRVNGTMFTTYIFTRTPKLPTEFLNPVAVVAPTRAERQSTHSLTPKASYPEPKESEEEWHHPAEDL